MFLFLDNNFLITLTVIILILDVVFSVLIYFIYIRKKPKTKNNKNMNNNITEFESLTEDVTDTVIDENHIAEEPNFEENLNNDVPNLKITDEINLVEDIITSDIQEVSDEINETLINEETSDAETITPTTTYSEIEQPACENQPGCAENLVTNFKQSNIEIISKFLNKNYKREEIQALRNIICNYTKDTKTNNIHELSLELIKKDFLNKSREILKTIVALFNVNNNYIVIKSSYSKKMIQNELEKFIKDIADNVY